MEGLDLGGGRCILVVVRVAFDMMLVMIVVSIIVVVMGAVVMGAVAMMTFIFVKSASVIMMDDVAMSTVTSGRSVFDIGTGFGSRDLERGGTWQSWYGCRSRGGCLVVGIAALGGLRLWRLR